MPAYIQILFKEVEERIQFYKEECIQLQNMGEWMKSALEIFESSDS